MLFVTKLIISLAISLSVDAGVTPSTLATFAVPAQAAFPSLERGESMLWAGHEVIEGYKEIPVIGKLKTRTETYSLARVTADPRVPGGLVLDAEACRVSFKKVAGIGVAMDARKLPRSRVRLHPEGNGLAGGGVVRWGREDVDGDGAPGAAVTVDSLMCGGTLHVSNESRISMRSTSLTPAGMSGRVSVRTDQSILKAEGRCLSRMAEDEVASSKGRFVYKRVAEGSTCSSLMRSAWPAKAK